MYPSVCLPPFDGHKGCARAAARVVFLTQARIVFLTQARVVSVPFAVALSVNVVRRQRVSFVPKKTAAEPNGSTRQRARFFCANNGDPDKAALMTFAMREITLRRRGEKCVSERIVCVRSEKRKHETLRILRLKNTRSVRVTQTRNARKPTSTRLCVLNAPTEVSDRIDYIVMITGRNTFDVRVSCGIHPLFKHRPYDARPSLFSCAAPRVCAPYVPCIRDDSRIFPVNPFAFIVPYVARTYPYDSTTTMTIPVTWFFFYAYFRHCHTVYLRYF